MALPAAPETGKFLHPARRPLSWNYVEIPSEYAADRPDLPISRHRFGIIATTRQLTAKERYTFDLEQVSGPPYSKD